MQSTMISLIPLALLFARGISAAPHIVDRGVPTSVAAPATTVVAISEIPTTIAVATGGAVPNWVVRRGMHGAGLATCISLDIILVERSFIRFQCVVFKNKKPPMTGCCPRSPYPVVGSGGTHIGISALVVSPSTAAKAHTASGENLGLIFDSCADGRAKNWANVRSKVLREYDDLLHLRLKHEASDFEAALTEVLRTDNPECGRDRSKNGHIADGSEQNLYRRKCQKLDTTALGGLAAIRLTSHFLRTSPCSYWRHLSKTARSIVRNSKRHRFSKSTTVFKFKGPTDISLCRLHMRRWAMWIHFSSAVASW
ncbi:hypothetical protein OF83DRAFT_1194634 [Amylostereum chailletii]|nr:hypothetical protein OF83DRAFT_1194634 [Amylostereum chailletii]